MNLSVIHNPDAHRFEIRMNDSVAVCEYEMKANVWYFNHTHVPDSMRGKGVAAQLVEYALTYVDKHQGRIVAQCSFVADFIRKNPGFAHLLVSE